MFDRIHATMSTKMSFYLTRSLAGMIALVLLLVFSQTRALADSVSQTFGLTQGSTPQWVAVTPDNSTVFVTNAGLKTISVFSVSGNTISIVDTIKPVNDLGNSNADPAGIGVTPDGTQLWVCLKFLNKVAVYNIPSYTLRTTVSVGSFPFAVAFKHNSTQAYVTNTSSNTVSIISVASDTVTNTVTVGTGPAGITNAFDPVAGTNTIFVANQASNTVSFFHPSDLVVGTISVGSGPFGVASGSSGTTVYVTNNTVDTLQLIDVASATVTKTVDNSMCSSTCLSGPLSVAVIATADGDRVYVADNTNGTVAKFKGNGVFKFTIGVGSAPIGVGATFTGTLVFVANQFSDSISVIDTTL